MGAGILQGVFFGSGRPKYLNYGAIGWVIGHEITHGFDDQGRQFDKEGNLRNWWHPDTSSRYLNEAECIIGQYSNYTFPELDNLPLNGVNTQGENIADNGGIKEAYRAYDKWVKTNGQELLLPGLNYTQRQMFWLSGANVWCSKVEQALRRGLGSCSAYKACSSIFTHVQACSRMFKHDQACSSMIKHVRACSSVFKHVQACSSMFKHVQACSSMFKHVQTYSSYKSMSKHVKACQSMSCMSTHVNACQCMSMHVNACQCMSMHVNACQRMST